MNSTADTKAQGRSFPRWLAWITALLCGAVVWNNALSQRAGTPALDSASWTYKGVAITAYWQDAFDNPYFEEQIDYYKRIGANAVEFVPVAYQAHMASNRIEPDSWQHKRIPDHALVAAIQYARKRAKLKVNLKPHLEAYPEVVPRLSKLDLKSLKTLIEKREHQALFAQCYQLEDAIHAGRLDRSLPLPKQYQCRDIIYKVKPELLWRARINPRNPAVWFESYGELLRHYLRIALDNDVEVFTLGTEMVCMTRPKYLPYWVELVEDLKHIRARAHADNPGGGSPKPYFTYAAHENEIIGTPNDEEGDTGDYALSCGEDWGDEGAADPLVRSTVLDPGAGGKPASPANIDAYRRFWAQFDIVSVTAYFKLGTRWPYELENATTSEQLEMLTGTRAEDERDASSPSLRARWQTKLRELSRWRRTVAPDKPVILAELGYRSVDHGHHKPYQAHGIVFPKLSDQQRYNAENQRRAFASAIDTLSGVEWIVGVFLWQEEIKMPPTYSRRENTAYSLIGKPSAAVIETAFAGGAATQWKQVPDCHSVDFDLIDRYDLDAGGGTALTRREDESSFAWVKARARPLSICVSSSLFDEAQFGLWASGAWGDGKDAPSGSDYSWDRYLVGVTAKFLRLGTIWDPGITWDIDLGIGELRNRSSSKGGRFRSRQHDDVFSLFTHLEWRPRDQGYRWFPKTELDFEGVWSLSADERRSWEGQPLIPDPLDRDRMEAVLSQSVYDWRILHGKVRVTPAVTLGYVWQDLDKDYKKAGFGLTLGLDKRGDRTDLATLRVHYEDIKGGTWQAAVWVDVLKVGQSAFER